MSNINLTEETANQLAFTFGALCDNGFIRVYGEKDNLLVELKLNNPAFKTPAKGVVIANDIEAQLASAEGVASKYEVIKSNGQTVLSFGKVGLSGSGAGIELASLYIPLGALVKIESYSHKVPYGIM
jgi:hypothetical protein